MNETFSYCHVVGKTDVGRKRAANEDNMYNAITQNGLVSVVCDGMGGHVGGATASKIAVSAIIENLNNVYYDDPRIAIGESIDRANKAVIQKTIEQPELSGMGSTCVLLLVRAGKVYIGHVGDSRIYLVRNKTIKQLTKDHSYVQMLVDRGEITKEQAEHHPRKNEITNALGIPNMSPATVADDAINPDAGDCFVLCSDGLSGMVSDDMICKIISRQSEMNTQERVDRLVALANENGGVDNITVQLVEFTVSPNETTDKKKYPTWAKLTCIVSVLAALGVAGYFCFRDKPTQVTEDNSLKAETENVIKCDTTKYHYPEKIAFKKGEKIVELEFGESSLILKRGGNQIYVFDSSFDQHSLIVSTPNVDIQYNNSLLSFTDVNPGDSVVFYITQSDKTKTYKCIFDISSTTIDSETLSDVLDQTIIQKVEDETDEEKPVVNVDTIDTVEFEYDKLEADSKLIFNYSAKPSLRFNKEDRKVCERMIETVLDNPTYDGLYWKSETKKGQFIFTFNGQSSDSEHVFVITCTLKNSGDRVVIPIKLVPKKKDDGDENPTNIEDDMGTEGDENLQSV